MIDIFWKGTKGAVSSGMPLKKDPGDWRSERGKGSFFSLCTLCVKKKFFFLLCECIIFFLIKKKVVGYLKEKKSLQALSGFSVHFLIPVSSQVVLA